jgi:hypothetical protein
MVTLKAEVVSELTGVCDERAISSHRLPTAGSQPSRSAPGKQPFAMPRTLGIHSNERALDKFQRSCGCQPGVCDLPIRQGRSGAKP